MDIILNSEDGGYIIAKISSRDRGEVMHLMANELLKEGYVKDSYEDAILEREKNYPTGLPTGEIGIAIPHTDSEHVIKEGMMLGILENPVEFNLMGGADDDVVQTQIIFMLAVKNKEDQLEMLQKLVEMFQDTNKLKSLQNITDLEEVKLLMGELKNKGELK